MSLARALCTIFVVRKNRAGSNYSFFSSAFAFQRSNAIQKQRNISAIPCIAMVESIDDDECPGFGGDDEGQKKRAAAVEEGKRQFHSKKARQDGMNKLFSSPMVNVSIK